MFCATLLIQMGSRLGYLGICIIRRSLGRGGVRVVSNQRGYLLPWMKTEQKVKDGFDVGKEGYSGVIMELLK